MHAREFGALSVTLSAVAATFAVFFVGVAPHEGVALSPDTPTSAPYVPLYPGVAEAVDVAVSLSVPDSPVRLAEFAVALSDRYGIMVRSGLQCAHPLFDALGQPEGVLRVSAYVYNSIQDANTLCESLDELLAAFGAWLA